MRKLALFVLLLVGISALAQQGKKMKNDRPEFTPEQEAELKAKELGLQLDLNEKQMKEVQELELKFARERASKKAERKEMKAEGMEKPSDEELFKMKNEKLDQAMEHQNEMKKILTPEQFEKWKEMRNDHLKKEREHFKEKRQELKEIKKASE
jgi:protein CpxP